MRKILRCNKVETVLILIVYCITGVIYTWFFFLSIIILWPFYFDILWKTSFENAWIPVTFACVYPQAMLVELVKRRNKLLQLAAGFVFLCFWLTAPVFNVCQFGRLQLTWQKRFACYKSFAPLATKTNVIFLFQLFFATELLCWARSSLKN